MQIQLFCCQLSGLTDVYELNSTHFFSTILRWLSSKWIKFFKIPTQCLKITEKVSFNIASEASYIYNLSGQKLIKKAKNWLVLFGGFLTTWSLRSNSVTRQVNFNKTKFFGKCQNWKTEMIFDWFSNTVIGSKTVSLC